MKRAVHAATAMTCGKEILEFIVSPRIRKMLVREAQNGAPPAGAISTRLLRKFGSDEEARKRIRTVPVKQFIGMCVRAVLEEEGYRIAQKGVRMYGNELFNTGSVYEPVKAELTRTTSGSAKGQLPKTKELLQVMAAALSASEAVQLAGILEDAHEGTLRNALVQHDQRNRK
jgi:hypothetical protein